MNSSTYTTKHQCEEDVFLEVSDDMTLISAWISEDMADRHFGLFVYAGPGLDQKLIEAPKNWVFG